MDQNDGVLISDWSSFARDAAQLYLGTKLTQELQSDSPVADRDTKVVSTSQTPPPAGGGGAMAFVRSPMGIAVLAGAALLLFVVLRR